MVFKKYIKRGGKTYGPYLYENKRVNGKVVTVYLGQGKPEKAIKKYFIWASVLIFLLLLTFTIFYQGGLTGNVVEQEDCEAILEEYQICSFAQFPPTPECQALLVNYEECIQARGELSPEELGPSAGSQPSFGGGNGREDDSPDLRPLPLNTVNLGSIFEFNSPPIEVFYSGVSEPDRFVLVSSPEQDQIGVAGQFIGWKMFLDAPNDMPDGAAVKVKFLSNTGHVRVDKFGVSEPADVFVKTGEVSPPEVFDIYDLLSVFEPSQDQFTEIIIDRPGSYVIYFSTQAVSLRESLIEGGKRITVENGPVNYNELAIISDLELFSVNSMEQIKLLSMEEEVEFSVFDSNSDGFLDYVKFFIDLSAGSTKTFDILAADIRDIGARPGLGEIFLSPFSEVPPQCKSEEFCGQYNECEANINANSIFRSVDLEKVQRRICFPPETDEFSQCPPAYFEERSCPGEDIEVEVKDVILAPGESTDFEIVKELSILDSGKEVAVVSFTSEDKIDIIFAN